VPSIDAAPEAPVPAAPLDGEGMSLSERIDRYRRKYVRHEVDWTAVLRIGSREVAVRLVDVSVSGAALEVATELELGVAATLCFVQLPGQPALPVIIKSRQQSIRRAGVAFTGPEDERWRLVSIADTPEAVPLSTNDSPSAATTRTTAADEAP
jgi:hypothetical protein